jgi:hypothetical protein
MRSLAIVPTYNERDNLQPLVRAVLAVDPTVLISEEGYVQHTDHRAAGIAARGCRPWNHRAGQDR